MEQDTPTSISQSPGQILRQRRYLVGLSEYQVALELKLPVEVISAIENDDYSYFSADLYVRGQLLNYAALLELASDEILDAWHQIRIRQQWDPSAVVSHPTSLPQADIVSSNWFVRTVSYAIGIIAFSLTFLWWQEQQPWPLASEGERLMAAMLEQDNLLAADKLERELEFVGLLEKYAMVEISQQNLAAPNGLQGEQPEGAALAVSVQSTGDGGSTRVVKPKQLPVLATNIRLSELPGSVVNQFNSMSATLNFDEASWVEVVDGTGERLMYELVDAGNKIVVRGYPPYNIHLGNAAGVTVEYDGEIFDHSKYIRHRTARFQLGAVDIVGKNS
ncbi:MAG TPA: hypothetical protein DCZ03_01500 [Gammaproteobacteria bacterium]|nr:hypothetical protein [Gammaproteobacteria bacterium]